MMPRVLVITAVCLCVRDLRADDGLLPAAHAGSAARLEQADQLAASARSSLSTAGALHIVRSAGATSAPSPDALERTGHELWERAFAEYLRMLDSVPTHLVAVEPGRFVQVRQLCQERIASLPAGLRQRYRNRVDPRARAWLEEASTQHDLRLLRRVVDEAFCSSDADRALDLLGDLLFEQGRFEEAEATWKRIHRTSDAPALAFPDSRLDPARTQAKRLLALLFQREEQAFAAGLRRFAAEYPTAAGNLAGRNGLYADTLRELGRRGVHVPDAGRHTPLVDPATPRRLTGPRWTFDFDTLGLSPAAGFPVLDGDQGYISDGRGVSAVDLRTGQVLWRQSPTMRAGELTGIGRVRVTLAEGRLFTILGPSLTCLDAEKGGKIAWQVAPPSDRAGRFVSTPLVSENRVYVVVRGRGEAETVGMVCYAASDGSVCWQRVICTLAAGHENAADFAAVLTQAEQRIIVSISNGVVAALHCDTGDLSWAVAPATKANARDTKNAVRGEPACTYSRGRVFVSSAGKLYCLDSYSGRRLWDGAAPEVEQVVGASNDCLVIATAGDLRALNTTTGEVLWRQPPDGGQATAGRGYIAAGLAVWPTRGGVHLVDVRTGRPAVDPQLLALVAPGNLVCDGRRLLVLSRAGLAVFELNRSDKRPGAGRP